MKKTIKCAVTLLAIFLLILPFASCAKGDEGEVIPTGMKIATCTGADYRLYVPTSWNANTAYGVSGAYYSLSRQSTVSVGKYPVTDALRAELDAAIPPSSEGPERISAEVEYYAKNVCLPVIQAQVLGGAVTLAEGPTPCLLEDVNALRYRYSAILESVAGASDGMTASGRNMQILQVVCERKESNAFYVFTFLCDGDLYENLLPDVEKMLSEFIFFVPYQPDEYAKVLKEGENAPAGMKLVSNDEVAYRFYVPEGWNADPEERIFSAYRDEGNGTRSVVSAVPFMPETDHISPSDFFAQNRQMMEKAGGEGSFVLLAETETVLGGYPAICYDYTYRIGDRIYRYRQFVTVYRGMVYNLTYTALPERFEGNLNDVERMRDAFAFR